MNHCLEQSENPIEAFKSHAVLMVPVSKHLSNIADMIAGSEVEVFADTHCITITCNEDLAQKLIDAELASKDPMEDEIEEEMDED